MIRSAFVGLLLALVIGLLVFMLGARTHAVTAYLAPGIFIGGLIAPVLPNGTAYWIVPDGGPLAFLGIVLACTHLFWNAAFGALHYVVSHRRTKAEGGEAPRSS